MDPIFDKLISQYGVLGLILAGQWAIIVTLWRYGQEKSKETRTRETEYLTKLYDIIDKVTKSMEAVQTKIGDIQGLNARLFDLLEKIVAGEVELKANVDAVKQELLRQHGNSVNPASGGKP